MSQNSNIDINYVDSLASALRNMESPELNGLLNYLEGTSAQGMANSGRISDQRGLSAFRDERGTDF